MLLCMQSELLYHDPGLVNRHHSYMYIYTCRCTETTAPVQCKETCGLLKQEVFLYYLQEAPISIVFFSILPFPFGQCGILIYSAQCSGFVAVARSPAE